MPRERLQALQLDRLRETIDRQLQHVGPRRSVLNEAGVQSSQDIQDLKDLQNLPFTHKSDLRDHYPFGLFASDAVFYVKPPLKT